MKNFDRLTELELICALSADISNLKLISTSSQDLLFIFKKIHENLFFDTYSFENDNKKPGFISQDILPIITNLFKELTNKVHSNPVIAIANFYHHALLLKPFNYGNNIVIRIFIHKLGEFLKLKFDFRTLNRMDANRLITNKNIDSIAKTLKKTLTNVDHLHNYHRVRSRWPRWPSASFEIKNKKFLRFKGKYLVAMDGTLVPIKNIEELENNNYCVDSRKFKEKLLSETFKKSIDGIPINHKKIPLINLNEDILTGLDVNNELPILISAIRKINVHLLELPERLNEIEDDGNELYLIATKAARRLVHTRRVIKQIARESFIGKSPTTLHNFFITIGGSGSGKGLLKEIALEITNNNLVEASLDKSRYFSFIYKLLIACEHHDDDYKIIAQFAYVLRDAILNNALAEDYNILFDGSGIPYKGRYDHLIEIFNHSGFKTHVLVAETPFYLSHSKNKGLDSYHKIINRFKNTKDHRALPWKVAIQKHAGQPRSQLDAAHDINVQSFIMMDTLPKKEDTYILATTRNVTEEVLNKLIELKSNSSKLLAYMTNNQLLPKVNNIGSLAELDFIVSGRVSVNSYRILIITNKTRFIESLKKCLLNTESLGKEDLFINTFPYLIPIVDFEYKY